METLFIDRVGAALHQFARSDNAVRHMHIILRIATCTQHDGMVAPHLNNHSLSICCSDVQRSKKLALTIVIISIVQVVLFLVVQGIVSICLNASTSKEAAQALQQICHVISSTYH